MMAKIQEFLVRVIDYKGEFIDAETPEADADNLKNLILDGMRYPTCIANGDVDLLVYRTKSEDMYDGKKFEVS